MEKDIKELEQLYASLGLDPETIEGDYREAFQKWKKLFDNSDIDLRFNSRIQEV